MRAGEAAAEAEAGEAEGAGGKKKKKKAKDVDSLFAALEGGWWAAGWCPLQSRTATERWTELWASVSEEAACLHRRSMVEDACAHL